MKLANNKFKNYLPVVATVPTKLASRNQRKEPKPSKPGCINPDAKKYFLFVLPVKF